MKDFLILLRNIILFILLIGIAILALIYGWDNLMSDKSNANIPPHLVETTDPNAILPPEDAQAATITHIHDGDTLFLKATEDGNHIIENGEVKVRLIGIDTPEVTSPKECYGDEATRALEQLIPKNSTVWVSIDNEAYDRYDRLLLYIWNADYTFINLEMVSAGYAEAIRVQPNDSYFSELKQAENEAYTDQLGMWGACNF